MASAKRSAPTSPTQPLPRIFSDAQPRTLAALAEGFVAGGGAARAAAAETAIAKVVDPGLHGQLRLVLNLLDTRIGSLLIGGRFARYGSLKASQRDEFLRRWVQHPVPMLRSGAAVFRKLLSFIAYSDADEPADALVRTRLSGLGYNPVPNPTTANVTKITAFDPGTAERIAVDVLVIGSGAGGGSIARDLSAAGREVLVIEAGGLYTEETFPTRERDAYERLYLDSGFTATADAHIAILAGGTVGGGTTVNWMT
ncbi:MAG: GMC family oxidoreductase N-terminal domain-containing protein, partial [Candidatus Limnocylindrus sp.]